MSVGSYNRWVGDQRQGRSADSKAADVPRRRTIRVRTLAVLLGFLALVAIFATPGSGSTFYATVTVASALLSGGLLGVLWLLGAMGLGRIASPMLRPIEDVASRIALQGVLGVALALALAHLLGVLGLMQRWVAWGPTLIGLVVLIHQARGYAAERAPTGAAGDMRARGRLPVLALLALPASALLSVAAVIPPGTLWASEGRGYDVLSYHLMLVREWIAGGRITPLTNNVYSFLPSYMEAAYAQLALMLGAGVGHGAPIGLGDGAPIVAANLLHALMGVATALVIGVHAHRIVLAHLPPTGDAAGKARATRSARLGAVFAGAVFLSVPWTIVVGSLAYNEMGVTLCFAGALVVAFEKPLRPTIRAALAAFLVGVACSVKPTALYLVAPATALALAFSIPARRWPVAAIACVPAGLAPLVPWLVRNWLVSGNPVFPAATSIFGPGQWSADQIARWNAEHYLNLSLADRFARLFDSTHGILHSQWSILFPLAAASGAVAIANRSTRRVALLASLMLLLKTIAWLGVGHLQSRFLISASVPASILVGLASFVLWRSRRVPRTLSYGVPIAAVGVLIGSSVFIFLTENGGAPDAALIPGVSYMNGSLGTTSPPTLGTNHAAQFYAERPVAFAINSLAQASTLPATTVLLVGDATPLYLGRAPNTIIYATTWDTNPLAAALRASGGDIDAALRTLRDQQGVTHLLISLAELDRLDSSGYLDPVLAPEAMLALARDHTRVVMRWDQLGVLLTAIPPEP